jgi:hypothetical protein
MTTPSQTYFATARAPFDLSTGRVVANGDRGIELPVDDDGALDPHDLALVDAGRLILESPPLQDEPDLEQRVASSTVAELRVLVGDDADLASRVRSVESKSDKPRQTLLDALDAVRSKRRGGFE